MRPAELARDETPHLPVLQHAVDWLRDHERYEPDAVMILQPTSPLRRRGDIRESIATARTNRRRFGRQRSRSAGALQPDADAARRRSTAPRRCS